MALQVRGQGAGGAGLRQGRTGRAGSWPPRRLSAQGQAIAVQAPVHAATNLPLIRCMRFPCHTPFRLSAANANLPYCPPVAGAASSSGGGAVAGETGLVDRRGRGRAAKLARGGQGRRGRQGWRGQGSEARRARVSMQWRVRGLGRAWVIPASQHRSPHACVLTFSLHLLSQRRSPLACLLTFDPHLPPQRRSPHVWVMTTAPHLPSQRRAPHVCVLTIARHLPPQRRSSHACVLTFDPHLFTQHRCHHTPVS